MAQAPYAYDKNPQPRLSRWRFWLGVALLIGSLAAVAYMFWNLQVKHPAAGETEERGR